MKRRTRALIAVWTLPSLIFLAATAYGYFPFRIPPPDRLDAADRAAVIAPLRAALTGVDPPRCSVHRPLAGPLAVTVWLDGHQLARVDGSGADIAAATDHAAAVLRGVPAVRRQHPAELERARIQVDLIGGRGAMPSDGGLFSALTLPVVTDMLAINPGIDGIGAERAGRQAFVLPHEVIGAKVLSAVRPSDAVADFAIGLDRGRLDRLVASRLDGAPPGATHWFRFRSDAFVEPPPSASDRAPLPLTRGNPPPPPLSAGALREAALAGGRYLVAHQLANGRYVYQHDLANGVRTDQKTGPYSMPRHAGTTYFLAQLYRVTKQEWLREPIERAFAYLVELLAAGHCGGTLPDGTEFECVLDRNDTHEKAHLGSTALTIVALVEYQRATGDVRYLQLATKLAAFVLYMQRPDGSFRHIFNADTREPDEHEQLLYYSGEAALALARMYEVTKDPRYARAAEAALDWLVDWYDFFMGGFFYMEQHWTCIAAEAIWPAVKSDKYREFCDGLGAFLRGQQPDASDLGDEADLAGAYMITPFVAPYNTPTGSSTEAMISAYLLDLDHGRPDPEIRAQIDRAMQYALGQQVRPDNDFSALGAGDGGVPESPVNRMVQIDYVQHVCSAMLRASELPGRSL